MRLFLGLKVCDEVANCGSCGIARVDEWGMHSLACKGKGGGMYQRHEMVVQAILQCCKDAEQPAKGGQGGEMTGLIMGTGQRPADIYLATGVYDLPEAWDVTIIYPTSQSTKSQAIKKKDFVLNKAVEQKRRDYEGKFVDGNVKFTPIAMDVFGAMHEDGMKIIERLATHAASVLEEPVGFVLKRFKTRIQVALFKQTSQMINYRG